ncbi:MAG TPA: ATP-dependent Clp protease proteolytic subunit [Planctomycetota bacterium]|jgi:ATP-dependent Clp protease protease subunit
MIQTLNNEDEKPKPPPEGKGGSEAIEVKLLESRTILVEGPVTDKMYRAIVARLLFLESKDPKAGITMVVNSPGGSADSGFGIYDVMKFVSCPITVLCAGLCASAAVLIFLGGAKGKRFMLPNSRFLLHQPSTQAFGQASDMEITANEILRTRKRYAEVVAHEIGSTSEKVESDSNRDFWLNADQSKKYGLVDKIIIERSEM